MNQGASMRDTTEPHTRTVRRLLRTRFRVALGTIAPDGAPHVSLVMLATAPDASPLLFISRLAEHTRHIEADARVSLLVDATEGLTTPLAGERATVCGRAVPCDDAALLDRYVRYHPDAAEYRQFGDFRLWRVQVTRAHLVAGFGRIAWVDGSELLLKTETWQGIAAVEPEAVAHLNADHAEALALYATVLAGAEPGPWRAVGLDPEGLDLAKERARIRLWFPETVSDGVALRAMLARLAREARARRAGDAPSIEDANERGK